MFSCMLVYSRICQMLIIQISEVLKEILIQKLSCYGGMQIIGSPPSLLEWVAFIVFHIEVITNYLNVTYIKTIWFTRPYFWQVCHIFLLRLLAHAKVESVRSKEAAKQRSHRKRSWFSFKWFVGSYCLYPFYFQLSYLYLAINIVPLSGVQPLKILLL